MKRGKQIATKQLPDARIIDRQLSQADYDKLRSKTPGKNIQNGIQEGFVDGMPDEALPGNVVRGRFQADHIVSVNQITKMDGFGKLTPKQQIEVLNNPDNVRGLSKAANKSKGKKPARKGLDMKRETSMSTRCSKKKRREACHQRLAYSTKPTDTRYFVNASAKARLN